VAAENLAPKRRLQADDKPPEFWWLKKKLAPKRRVDDKVEPWWPKTWPQKGESMTKLSRGGRKPGPKKARRVDDKVEPWWPKTWPQKGDYKQTTNRSFGG
jgi:hypothetical protein